MKWDVFNRLEEALSFTGLILEDGLPSYAGHWLPCPTEKHPRKRNGRILVLFSGVALLWNWENDIKAVFNPNHNRKFTDEEKRQFREALERLSRQREKEQISQKQAGTKKAKEFLKDCCIPFLSSDCFPYFEAKHVGAYNNVYLTTVEKYQRYFYGRTVLNDCPLLVFPLSDGVETVSLQFIAENGEKRFMTGGITGGAYWVALNQLSIRKDNPLILIAEGVATLLTVLNCEIRKNPDSNLLAVAGMNCGNLEKVAGRLRNKYKGVPVLILADNDENETGIKHARRAQQLVGNCRVSMPDFKNDCTSEELKEFRESHGGKNPTDWNDYYLIKRWI